MQREHTMKALSLWQPWGSLWLSPRKVHETRHWRLQVPAGGFWLVVHAAKRFEKDFDPFFASLLRSEFGATWFRDLPRGALIGAVHVVACVPTHEIYPAGCSTDPDWLCGDFTAGRYGFRRDEFVRFEKPVPWRGLQGIFTVPADALPEMAAIVPP